MIYCTGISSKWNFHLCHCHCHFSRIVIRAILFRVCVFVCIYKTGKLCECNKVNVSLYSHIHIWTNCCIQSICFNLPLFCRPATFYLDQCNGCRLLFSIIWRLADCIPSSEWRNWKWINIYLIAILLHSSLKLVLHTHVWTRCTRLCYLPYIFQQFE